MNLYIFKTGSVKKYVLRDKFIIPKTSLCKTLYFKTVQLRHKMIKKIIIIV